MSAPSKIVPFSLKDAPALIERALPVQRLSVESFKEQMAGNGKTLASLGSYWKGRKPLILNKACVLAALLPATSDLEKDLEIFEALMGMDDVSLAKRLDLDSASQLPAASYAERVRRARRPEEIAGVHDHIWPMVNAHLGTSAVAFSQLVEQLGVMRFGRRPRLGDAFSGSGQIPFEAARLGCDVEASDLNPIACMLTWGAMNIVGSTRSEHADLDARMAAVMASVLHQIDELGIETDDAGWRAKAYLYCVEVRCPESDWMVPLLPSRVVSYGKKAIALLVPDPVGKRYEIEIRCGVSDDELAAAETGTLRSDGRGKDPYLLHEVAGTTHRTQIATIRGDYRTPTGDTGNRLRPWSSNDFRPTAEDTFQERLYAVHWMKQKAGGKKYDYEFRGVGPDDQRREEIVERTLQSHFAEWQERGWIPDMRIEGGDKTSEPVRTRGWTHWHHLFPPRHLLLLALLRQSAPDAVGALMFARVLDFTSKLCRWSTSRAGGDGGQGKRTGGASDNPANVFYNQALNTFYNYGCRATLPILRMFAAETTASPRSGSAHVTCAPSAEIAHDADLWITDPPYGDAVKYEEILEFFIAWLRKNPPSEFAQWTWDSRRALAVKGEGESFRRDMVAAYRRMTEHMPDNGLQVIMFTHQSGTLWADMANIVWASGLRVTAAWYVATETDSALRDGAHVKGTVLLVLRKRIEQHRVTRDDLAWELQEAVEQQVAELTGLTQAAKLRYRDDNLFGDADLQMAGYAAALRVLTRYAVIDGKDMTTEAEAPRVKGERTTVDALIDFAVGVANQALVPRGLAREHWRKLLPAERLYLKLLDAEAQGAASLDGTQNFAKAFKVNDVGSLLASAKAKDVRLKTAAELGNKQQGGELGGTMVRAGLYAIWQMGAGQGDLIVPHFEDHGVNLFDAEVRSRLLAVIDFVAVRDEQIERRAAEASDARALAELLRNQKL